MSMVDSVHEECGVFGIYDPIVSNVAQSTYFALYALQHRGQESCGIAVNEDGIFRSHRALGLVPEVFTAQVLEKLGREVSPWACPVFHNRQRQRQQRPAAGGAPCERIHGSGS